MSSPIFLVGDIHKSFGGLRVLSGVSFEVQRNSILSLIGPNGAGKTTLFNIVTGLVRPDQGRVAFAGTEIQHEPAHKRARRGIGRTFQHPQLFPRLSVLENVMIGGFHRDADIGAGEREANRWLSQLQLDESVAGDMTRLTLLQRKFVEIARAMAGKPILLLLDEVLAGLTPTELEQAMSVIRGIRASGVTIILIEHVMSAVMKLSDTVVVLADGRIIANGPPNVVTRNPEVLRAYLGAERARA